MNVEEIARVAHEINRAYCQALGDYTQPEWDDAPQWQRDSAAQGVLYHLQYPDAGPEDGHNVWLAVKKAEGWVYGERKDAAAKTHPCMMPFWQLPAEQRAKDFLFRAVVRALAGD